ncbi:MAG TPA: signal recognition particle-docking protein FtsY [Candidatus Babeliaceae bacterium]|nr:signal recognition particle-docking protein FtsY [Candidatus Babeliaceae bacterium]
MFNFIKSALQKIYNQVTSRMQGLFAHATISDQDLEDLRRILIEADTGVKTTNAILKELSKGVMQGRIQAGADLKSALYTELLSLIDLSHQPLKAKIYLLVGINGSGKTTFAAKLAYHFQQQKKRVLLVAADTFRAAAVEQLCTWAERLAIDIVTGNPGQDPASVIFAATEKLKNERYDIVIIDTAGRLQTKVNLMNELEKIRRIIHRQLPSESIATLLTVDSMLGQNSLDQARLFHESTPLSGIVLTKIDGTGKGGIVFAIAQELQIPVRFLSYGEKVNELSDFNPQEYVRQLLEK